MHSRKVASAVWLTDLKTVLNNYGSELRDWEIYRKGNTKIRKVFFNLWESAQSA